MKGSSRSGVGVAGRLGCAGRVAAGWVGAAGGGDVGGADAVAVGDGGEPLDVASEQAGEDLGLGLAQLRELGGDVGDRAVVLAQLVADRRAAHRGGVAVLAQRLGEHLGASSGSAASSTVAVAVLELGGAAAGELGDGFGAARLAQEAQRAGGQVVVGLDERVAAGVGEHEDLGRAAAAAGAVDARLARFEGALGDQVVEVAANGGRGEVEPFGQGGGGGGAVLEDRGGHPLARGGVVDRASRPSGDVASTECVR